MENSIAMSKVQFYTSSDLLALTHIREGEKKLGQEFCTIASLEQLTTCAAPFVLVGLAEDIGVLANGGKPGTAHTWHEVLPALCNCQSTEKVSGSDFLVLGCLRFDEEQKQAQNADTNALRALVTKVDEEVTHLIQAVFAAGKVPIVIGGGHNNAYPILKALSLHHNQAVHVINIDAHADFRALEGRHSGNSFSYAYYEGFLEKYAVLGLHENYNSQHLRTELAQNAERIRATYFEDFLREKISPKDAFLQALEFTDGLRGLELDLDSIAYASASAASPSGFTAEQIRSFLYQTQGTKIAYLHLCEGIVTPGNLLAKLIGYFITDFVKAQNH